MAQGKRRSKDQIFYHILSLCEGEGAGKTRIVYALNLNFENASEYLDLLVKNGLLEAGHGRGAPYKTTQRGMEVLEYIRAIRERIPELCD